MYTRPLQAVVGADPRHLAGLVRPALDGTGPALLPLSGDLPTPRLRALLAAMRPATVRDGDSVHAFPDPAPVAEDTALVVATSGSTGLPKGVELSASALRCAVDASLRQIDRDSPGDGRAWLCVLPTDHIAGLLVLLRALAEGGEPLVSPRFDPHEVMDLARPHRPRVSLVPTQLRRLLAAGADLSELGTILLGGAAADDDLLAAARRAGARVVCTYGMSETCGGCVYDGVPLDGVAAEVDAEGHVRFGGPMLFTGYRLAPELTARHLHEEAGRRWFTTGDLGDWRGGRLRVLGRADDVIITGGHKVVPAEVAEVIGRHEAIAEAVVVGRADPEWGERVAAVVVPATSGQALSLPELRSWVRRWLPAYAAPRELDVRSTIPLLSSGKPDLARLRSPVDSGEEARGTG